MDAPGWATTRIVTKVNEGKTSGRNRLSDVRMSSSKRTGKMLVSCQLSELLRLRRMPQTRLAELTGVHRNTILKLCHDDWTAIRRDALTQICAVLGVTVGEFLVWRDERE